MSMEYVPHQKQNWSISIFLSFAPKHRLWVLVCGYGEAVITYIHNLCFEHE